MYLTGFADEASQDIDVQIQAVKELGWDNIEMRVVGGKMAHDLSDEEFDVVYGKLQDAGVRVNCLGSAIANSGKSILDPFEISLGETERSINRMKKLGTKMVRMMSYAVLRDREADDQLEEERFRRLREIHRMFTGAGLLPVHENCMNYGGMGWTYTLRLLENVPGLRLVFDTGNPVCSDDCTKSKPYPKQSAWEFYSHVREYVDYVHIKDGIWDGTDITWTYPGEGQGDVRRIVKDLLSSGYDGGFSIEPHMAVVFHDPSITSVEKVKYDTYVEYGRRMTELIDEIKNELC